MTPGWWTEKRMVTLQELWERGLSFTAIAKEMGATKGAIAGKKRTMGLERRVTVERALTVVEREPVSSPSIDPLALTMDMLARGQCKFPLGDGPFTFCGAPCDGVYCVAHRRVVYRPDPQRARHGRV